MFELKFETLNAGIQTSEEVRRILKHIGQKVDSGRTSGKVQDVNGNTIGEWAWRLPPEVRADKLERATAEKLALELCHDSTFYGSSSFPLIKHNALLMFNGKYSREEATHAFFRQIVLNQRQGEIRLRIGRTSDEVKLICARIMVERYENDMEFFSDEIRDKSDGGRTGKGEA